MSFWNYRGRCIGRVIHFLYHYAGIRVAEHATIGGDTVEYGGKKFAEFGWSDRFGECDVPEFVFLDDAGDQCAAAQIVKRKEAILDACAFEVPADGRIHVDAAILRVLERDGYHSADIFCHGVHGARPRFFVHEGRLFAEANDWIYGWLPGAKNWTIWVVGKRRPAAVGDATREASLP